MKPMKEKGPWATLPTGTSTRLFFFTHFNYFLHKDKEF